MRYIVILGNRLKRDGTMRKYLIDRLLTGIQIYDPSDIIIVSGGRLAGQLHSEAFVMKQFLKNYNIPSKNIICENKSKSTVQNIKQVAKLLHNNLETIIIITSQYHMKRTKKIVTDILRDRKNIRFMSS
jgi:uncharacterized SAM-binding protein YcdF (DUF218 family)